MKSLKPSVYFSILLATIIMQAVFVASYVHSERTFYFWDHAMYFEMARGLFSALDRDLGSAWIYFKSSLAENYNFIFALPSLLTFALFGVSRQVFILTNFFVFFIGYEVAAAFFLRRLFKLSWPPALLYSFASATLTPPLWLPLLEGYPDNGAAACIALGAALAYGAPGDKKFLRCGLMLGFILGIAILLRRHFVYPALAVIMASGLMALAQITQTPTARGKKFMETVAYYGAVAVSCAGILFIIAPDFVLTALTTNYTALYQSYQRSTLQFLYFIEGGFGVGLLVIAVVGLVLITKNRVIGSPAFIYCGLLLFLWLTLWCCGPGQMGHHYMLHVLPLLIAAGLTAGYLVLEQRKKYITLVLICFALFANTAWALWLSPHGVWPNDNGTPGLLSAARPPVVRSDYDELLQLADHLVTTTTAKDRIYVVGSSFILNLDLMQKVFAEKGIGLDMMVRFPKTPEIDHEEPAPFDAFASANVYLVPTPTQYHLNPESQKVITAAANQFPPPPTRSDLFNVDDRAFKLSDGVTLKIWRRGSWLPGALSAALSDIRRDGPQDPALAQFWTVIEMPLRSQVRTSNDGATTAAGLFHPMYDHMTLFYDPKLRSGPHQLSFTMTGDCPLAEILARLVDETDRTLWTKDLAPDLTSGASLDFTVPAEQGHSHFLELELKTAPATLCQAQVQQLRLKTNQGR